VHGCIAAEVGDGDVGDCQVVGEHGQNATTSCGVRVAVGGRMTDGRDVFGEGGLPY
jgi:hypothetical protein